MNDMISDGKPRLTTRLALKWADAYRKRTGKWPSTLSGRVREAPRYTWITIDRSLRKGHNGLSGGTSLAKVLTKYRGHRNKKDLPRLRIKQILAWADAHRKRTGQWPNQKTGPVREAPGETWDRIDDVLYRGYRGLPGGSSLIRLLSKYRGVRNRRDLRRFTVKQILGWADAYYKDQGRWPSEGLGTVPGRSGDTWSAVSGALRTGRGGLPGGSSLPRLLSKHRNKCKGTCAPALTVKKILAWADAHYQRTGEWPNARSGPVHGVPGEAWRTLDWNLTHGKRGLCSGSTLVKLLAEHCRTRRSSASARSQA